MYIIYVCCVLCKLRVIEKIYIPVYIFMSCCLLFHGYTHIYIFYFIFILVACFHLFILLLLKQTKSNFLWLFCYEILWFHLPRIPTILTTDGVPYKYECLLCECMYQSTNHQIFNNNNNINNNKMSIQKQYDKLYEFMKVHMFVVCNVLCVYV